MSLVLGRKIVQAKKKGFGSYCISGRRNIGKTAYSMVSTYQAFMELGYDSEDAWKETLNSIHFSIKDVTKYLRSALDTDERKLVLIWDDLRVFASGVSYHRQRDAIIELQSLLDVIRTCVSTIITTTPSLKGVLGMLQSYDDFLIKIHYSPRGGWYREARAYQWSTIPSGKRLIYARFQDSYSCYVVNWVYHIYMDKRKAAVKRTLDALDKIVVKDNL